MNLNLILEALKKGTTMDSTQKEFLKDLNVDENADPFAQRVEEPEASTEEAQPEEDKFNRRERRLRDKLQAERESSIALAARLDALTEAQKFSRDTQVSSYEEKAMRIWGNETPEARAGSELLIAALKEAKDQAKEEALDAFREEQKKERDSVKAEEDTLDSMIEDIEDQYNVTLDETKQKGFFQLLERLSPKDTDGNILHYADPHSVWEELQSRQAPKDTRAKDLASRSMTRTGASPSTTVEADTTERYLRENGII